MGILNYFFFALICGSIILRGQCSNIELNEYLREKLIEAKVNIARNHIQASQTVFVNNYNVSWSKSWDTIWGTEQPLTINMFDEILFSYRNGTLDISMNVSTSNEDSNLKENSIIDQAHFIKFIRTIKWKTTLYLFLCSDVDWCSLYTGNNITSLIHRQHIEYLKLIDAHFFTKANRLYLILVDDTSVIYDWAGTYMDIYKTISTPSAVSVATFKSKQSIIMIFAQNSKSDSNIASTVYEFKGNNIETIQVLSINKPISVHHYFYNNDQFVLITNEIKGSNVYWWDGKELIEWIDIPEIKSHYSMKTVYLQDGTYFIVAHDDVVELFTVYSITNYASVSVKKLNNKRKIVDMQTLLREENVTLIMTTIDREGFYFVEIWDLNIENKTSHGNKRTITDASRECLSEVIELLQNRLTIINKFESFFLKESSFKNNSNVWDAIELPSIIFKSGFVEKINLFVEEEVLTPSELQQNVDDLESKIDNLFKKSLNILRANTTNNITGTVDIIGDAFFKELIIDTISIDKLNNVSIRSKDLISLKDDQQFESTLRAENITVHDLQVNSFCGIPNQYWATIQNKDEKILIKESDRTSKINLSKNEIFIYSNISIPNLKVKKINDIDMDKLIDQLFVIGGNQTITGNIKYNCLEVKNLKTKMYNGLPSTYLMTKAFDQYIPESFIKTLEVDSLYTESINGIPVSEFAMKSRENVIDGEVILDKMEVMKMLTMNSDAEMSIIAPSQIYDNVKITGDVVVKRFDFEENGKLIMGNLEVKPREIFHKMWTKSTDQTIENDISFDFGVTMNRLETKYLNGFTDKEFLYTTIEKIPSIFTNLHFKNLHMNDFFQENETKLNSIDVHQDRIVIRGDLHVGKLQSHHLITNNYNNISVDVILNNSGNLNLSENINLPEISVKHAIVRELNLDYLNDRAVFPYLEIFTKIYKKGLIKTPKFRAEEIVIENFDGKNISHLIELQNATIADIIEEIIIDGDLVLSEDLNVLTTIGGYPIEMYLKKIAFNNISITTGMMEQLIVQNITMEYLEGYKVDTLFSNIFSKTGSQKIPGEFTFHTIRSDNVEANYVNEISALKLMWINEPLIFEGNVTFTDLFIDKDISTEYLNGYDIDQLYQNPIYLTSTKIWNLHVNGHITWENSNQSSKSLSYLFEKALRKDIPQDIQGNITFTKDLHISYFTGDIEDEDEIRKIIEDTVLENSEEISLSGQKIFYDNLTTNTLKAQNVIDIETINGINIVELNDSIVNKYEENVITGSINFLNEVTIDNLNYNGTLHDTPITDLVLFNQILPNNTYMKNLVVMGDISLETIDNVDFDEFVKNRVTLSKNHVITSDIQFQGRVEGTGNAVVNYINDIDTSELVFNSLKTTQIISGRKTFVNDVTVNKNVYVPLINGINLNEEFSNSVLNENVIITGNLIFQSHLNVSKNVIVTGLVNGVNVNDLTNDLDDLQNRSISLLKENKTFIENAILKGASVIRSLPSVFAYLEKEENLKIEVPAIKKIDVVRLNSILKLNMYGEQNGNFCGLPENCSCPLQYVAELMENNCHVWRWNNTSITQNWHDPNNHFGIDVTTSSVSYNSQCTRKETDQEFSTISWMSNENFGKTSLIKERYSVVKVKGFLKDSKTFTYDDEIYIIMAIYYDPIMKTHNTNSFIYKLNFTNENLTLHQKIPTNGATALEILQINKNIYIFIACDGNTKIGSLMYKLNSVTSKFVSLKRFPGKSNSVKSFVNDDDYFIMFNDIDTNALNIYNYNYKFDNFYYYQSFFFDSSINGIQSFYIGEFGNSDGYIIVTTEDGQFYVYEYMFAEKFQRKFVHQIDGLQTIVPFRYKQYQYLIYGTKTNTTVMRIVQHGLH